MGLLDINSSMLQTLKDKVVVITGGAAGIGRAAAIDFHKNGAKVVIGDVATKLGQELEAQLGPRSRFHQTNTASYTDQLALFALAQETFGRIDIVIANAAVVTYVDYFAPTDDISEEPPFREVDINLRGVLFTARIGLYYLRKAGAGELIMTSSIGGFKETANLTPYVATKHGVIGTMRGLRLTTLAENICVNVICPWMTTTAMTAGVVEGWQKLNLPLNRPEDAAKAMLICATANRCQPDKVAKGIWLPFHGKIIYLAGGDSYEIEDRLQELEPQWLGEENSRLLKIGQEYLLDGATSWAH